MFLRSINIFRGISIFLVVAGHTLSISGLHPTTIGEKMIISLISGATTMFIFISGFLFHHVFSQKFDYKKFILSKFRNIAIPYTLISFPIILLTLYMEKYYSPYFMPSGAGIFDEWFVPFFKYYVTGRVLTGYWYIPFIIIMFLLSPLHIIFLKMGLWKQIAIVCTFYILALIIHRPIGNTNQFQNIIYGTAPYLLGMLCSMHRRKMIEYLDGWKIFFLIIAICFSYYQSYIGKYVSSHKDMFVLDGIDLMLLQKTFICVFAFIFLQRFENKSYRIIDTLSRYSFGIFFVHAPIIRISEQFLKDILPDGWIAYISYSLILVMTCYAVVRLSRALFKDKSRYIVGY